MTENMWMIRAGEGADYFEDFKEKNVVAIGWNKVGDICQIIDKEKIKDLIRENYDYKKGRIRITASQLYRFVQEIVKDDYVLTYNPDERIYLLGRITSDSKYTEDLLEYYHIREVEWLGKVNRDDLSTSTKNVLGAIATLFKIGDEATEEIISVYKGEKEVLKEEEIEEEEELDELKEDVENRAREFVKDKILELSWEEMEELVAGVLRGMGYKTRMTSKGPDRGRDIEASPDGLGFKQPSILVEVKHRKKKMGSSDISSLKGALSKGKNGLYVSTGGFTKEAKYAAEGSSDSNLKLLNLDELVDLIFEYYDSFDPATRSLLPLTKIYWPKA